MQVPSIVLCTVLYWGLISIRYGILYSFSLPSLSARRRLLAFELTVNMIRYLLADMIRLQYLGVGNASWPLASLSALITNKYGLATRGVGTYDSLGLQPLYGRKFSYARHCLAP